MSWHYSLALVAEFSALNCLDGESCAQLKSTRTAERSYFDDRKKASSKRSRYGTILEPLMVVRGIGKWMSLLEASPASPSRLLDSNGEQTTSGICGPTPFALLEKSDQGGVSWRTCQLCLLQDTLEQFSEIWPRAAMMRDGKCYRQLKLELPISEIGSGLWPSPREQEPGRTTEGYGRGLAELIEGKNQIMKWPTPRDQDSYERSNWKTIKRINKEGGDLTLTRKVKYMERFPTPNAWDGNRGPLSRVNVESGDYQVSLVSYVGGQLSPDWVEILMGWCLGWTSLNPINVIEYKKWLMGFKECCLEAEAYGGFPQEKNRSQEMPTMRQGDETQSIRKWEAGGLQDMEAAEVLQSQVCELPQGDVDSERLHDKGEGVDKRGVRGLLGYGEAASPPYRRGYNQQPEREYTDPMYPLSQVSSRYGREAWLDGSWEDGIPRVATGIPNRVDRLKALGNGQVPLCVKVAWEILSKDSRT